MDCQEMCSKFLNLPSKDCGGYGRQVYSSQVVERAKSSLVPWPNIKIALPLIARNESCVGRNLTGLSIMFPAFALASELRSKGARVVKGSGSGWGRRGAAMFQFNKVRR